MCKDSITDTAKTGAPTGRGTDQAGIPAGFNFSVYYMLIGVFATSALVIGIIARGIRSTNNQRNLHATATAAHESGDRRLPHDPR
jgi:hypothetical protein